MVKHKASTEPEPDQPKPDPRAEPVQDDPGPRGAPGPEFDPVQEDVKRPRPVQDPDGTPLGDVPPESGIGGDKGDKGDKPPPLQEHLPSQPGGSPYHLPTPNPGDPAPQPPGSREPLEPERPTAQEMYQAPAYDMNAEARKINDAVLASLVAAGLDYWAGKQLLERAKALLGSQWVEQRDAAFKAN